MTLPLVEIDYFDHQADIGIIGRGKTLEAAFVSAAQAMFNIMVDKAAIAPQQSLQFEFEEAEIELALVTWLNLLLAEAKNQGLVLGKFALRRVADHWYGQAWGEPWRDDLPRGTEVKGATLTMLAVKPITNGWEARCVVDV
ncbi:MAG: archease [Gammaproteobacteria bacterium]